MSEAEPDFVFDDLTVADLIAERDRLMSKKLANAEVLASCRAQITAAKAAQIETGKFANAKWYAAVHSRASYAGQEDQQIQRQLAQLKPLLLAARKRETIGSDQDAIGLLCQALELLQRAIDMLKEHRDADPQ